MRDLHSLDEISYSSPARNWPPLGKFFLALSLLAASLLSTTVLVPLIAATVGFMLLFHSTRFKFPKVISLAIINAAALLAIGSGVIAIITPGNTLLSAEVVGNTIVLSKEGLSAALLVFLRSISGMAVMLFFATSTPIPHFAYALRQIRLPVEISELFILVYRYAFLLLEQLHTMHTSAACRLGFKGLRNKIRTTSKLSVGLFIRSLDMAERSHVALNCRCFTGSFPAYRKPASMRAFWVILPIATFLSLFFLSTMFDGHHGWW